MAKSGRTIADAQTPCEPAYGCIGTAKRPRKPQIVYDLPTGGRRFIQRADGYLTILLAGTPTFENGEHTGALPGGLRRSNGQARKAA